MRRICSSPSSSLPASCYLVSPHILAPSLTSLFAALHAGANPLICAKQQFSVWHWQLVSDLHPSSPESQLPYQQQVSGEPGTIYLR